MSLASPIDRAATAIPKEETRSFAPPSPVAEAKSVLDTFDMARKNNGIQRDLDTAKAALAAMKAEAAQNSEALRELQAEANETKESLLDHQEFLGGMTDVVKSTISMLEAVLAEGHEDPKVLSKDIETILAKLRRINEITD
jgi:hypothetical protein